MGKKTPDDEMREFLTGDDRVSAMTRQVFRRVPSGPNCKICAAPFAGPGGAVLRHVGFGRFAGNPMICNFCIKGLQRAGVQGAEIPVSLLFADIRGSTAIGEHLSPTDFRAFLDHFYRLASRAVLDNDGIVDKFVGDEVIGLFFGGVSGDRHAAAAVAAGRRLLARAGRRTRRRTVRSPSVRACIRAWPSWVRRPTDDVVNDFTALGDVVNTTSRLTSEAARGELLVSVDAASAAGTECPTSSVGRSRSAADSSPWTSSSCRSRWNPTVRRRAPDRLAHRGGNEGQNVGFRTMSTMTVTKITNALTRKAPTRT